MYFDRAERPETAADEHVAAGGAMEIGDPVAYARQQISLARAGCERPFAPKTVTHNGNPGFG